MKETTSFRIEGYTSVTWRKVRLVQPCASCSQNAAFFRVTRKKSRTSDRLEIVAFCQRHAEKAGLKVE